MKITTRYLKKVFDKGAYGLRDVSLNIESGEFAVIVGESGSGKSTLLRLISGLEKPTAGEVYLDGLLADNIAAKNRRISMVFQEYVLYPRFTVWENLSVALERYKLSREEEDKRIKEVLKVFELTDVAGQLPKYLSGGQQQRVALARAVVAFPKAILFDEPLSNIAEKQRIDYLEYLKELKRKLPDVTFVYVTHNLNEAFHLADKLIVMKDGVVLQQGKRDFLMKNPYSAEVLRVLSPEADERNGEIYNIFADKWQRFDENGAAFEQPRYLKCFGDYDGKNLSFLDVNENVDDQFDYRFIGDCGRVIVGIPTDSIHGVGVFGDVAISADRISDNEFFLSDGTSICLKNISDFHGKLYFPLKEIELFDTEGNRCLAHYKVYVTSTRGKAVGKRILLSCGSMYSETPKFGSVRVVFGKNTKGEVGKKGLKIKRCLDEEILGEEKLCYCYLKGFDQYVAIRVPWNSPFLQKNKIRLDLSSVIIYN